MIENIESWSIDDLRVVKSEEFVDDDGQYCFCIYSLKLDAVTFVDDRGIEKLRERGIKEIHNLPD
jgi:hypothetical protein